MVSFPPCKINLGLNIVRKRPDGFHDIETCFYPVPLTDVLEVIRGVMFSFSSSGPTIPGIPEDNICVKAYRLLEAEFGLGPVQIHLHKIIPTGAGLGGGSSDAAHCLRLLNRVFDLQIPTEKLRDFASKLGSDCAFFITDIPMMGKGRGEILDSVNVSLKGKYLVLVNPDIHVSTAEAYTGVTPRTPSEDLTKILMLEPKEWRHKLTNEFEISVFSKFPKIAQVKDLLYRAGAEYAAMSGSGATVFGIFSRQTNLQGIAEKYIIWKGTLP